MQVVSGSCGVGGAGSTLTTSAVSVAADGLSVSFAVNSASANGSWTVCVQAGASAAVAVPSAGALLVAVASDVQPLGLASTAAGSGTLTVRGTGLASTDAVRLVGVASGGGASDCNNSGTPVVVPPASGTIDGSGNLVVVLPVTVGTGQYHVCVRLRGIGAWYGLSTALKERFSVVSTASVAPRQYNFVNGSARTLTVSGNGLSSRDAYYVVAVTGSGTQFACADTALSGVTASGTNSPDPFSASSASVSVSGISGGRSYGVCLQPGGELLQTRAIAVGIVSSVQVTNFTPLRVPLTSGNVVTVTGAGFGVGQSAIVKASFCVFFFSLFFFFFSFFLLFFFFFFWHKWEAVDKKDPWSNRGSKRERTRVEGRDRE